VLHDKGAFTESMNMACRSVMVHVSTFFLIPLHSRAVHSDAVSE
jgi:hypothetical protein